MKHVQTIMLVDDNKADNVYHKVIINMAGFDGDIVVFQYAEDALAYLQSEQEKLVDLILLDINMPRMNGFEFLQEYGRLSAAQKAKAVIVMLTTSLNPDDETHARTVSDVRGFMNKPLTVESFQEIVKENFETTI